ncbi:recombinase family protein [Candidatus Saccharibacteria bacterium]|nr:recombinase family protein [Candidatus Saccharibacteria bacterium]
MRYLVLAMKEMQENTSSDQGTTDLMPQDASGLKYCLYARKSTEQDERQAMSIESQIKEMKELAKREGLYVAEIKRESHSAKESGLRPVFNEMITELKANIASTVVASPGSIESAMSIGGKFNAILTWAPDRLARNAGDLGSLVDLMDQKKLIKIRTFTQEFKDDPNSKFLLMILGSQAKLENDNRGLSIKRGVRAKCESGWRPGPAPLGYMNRSFNGQKDIIVDPDRAPVIKELFERTAQGMTGRKALAWLNNEVKFTSKAGNKLSLSMLYLILNNPFYYGEFEYPAGSGTMWPGKHKPIVTKELWQQIQDQKRDWTNKIVWGSKQYAFKNLFVCGSCGGTFTATDCFSQKKDGTFTRRVYYHCTKMVDPNCKERRMREDEILEQLTQFFLDNVGKIRITDELRKTITRYKDLAEYTLRRHNVEKIIDDPLGEYANFIFQHGSYAEQTKLVENIHTAFVIRDKKMRVNENLMRPAVRQAQAVA